MVQLFDERTRRALGETLVNGGFGVAGRGAQLNEAFADLPTLARDASAQLRAATREEGALGDLVVGAAGTASGLRGERSDDVAALIGSADATFDTIARRGEELRETIEALRPFEDQLLTTAPVAEPLLDDLAALAADLEPTVRAENALLPDINRLFARGGDAALREQADHGGHGPGAARGPAGRVRPLPDVDRTPPAEHRPGAAQGDRRALQARGLAGRRAAGGRYEHSLPAGVGRWRSRPAGLDGSHSASLPEPDPQAGRGATGLVLSVFGKRLVGFGLIAAAVIAVALGISRPNPFADTRSYWAVFDTAQGLGAIDRDVRVSGAKVGTIHEVVRVGDDVRLELVLFEDVPIHADARVDMRPHTLFEGSSFVDLHPGSPSVPVLEPGDEIPLEQTTNYVTLDEALRVLRPEIRESMRRLAKAGSATLRDEGVAGVQRMFERAPRLSRALGPAARAAQGPERRELVGAIGGLAQTVDGVARSEEQLIPFVRRVNRTNAALTLDRAAPLDAALAALPGTLRELNESAPALTGLIDRLDRFSHAVTPALPELAPALRETTPVVARATPVLRRAIPLIRDARLVSSRLGRASEGGLTEMLRLTSEPIPKLRESLDVANAPSVHGAPGFRQLVAGAFTGGDAIFRGYQTPAQHPEAPGHVFRIGNYINPAALTPLPDLLGGGDDALPLPAGAPRSMVSASCADVARVSRRAARELEESGGCR